MVERRVKPRIAHRDSASRNSEGLDRAIEVLVIDRVFIMPEADRWIRHFIGNKGTAIDSRRRFDRVDGRSGPGVDGRGPLHDGSRHYKREIRGAVDQNATVRRVVIHIALAGMGLAPGVLIRRNVLDLGIISRTRIRRRVQVAPFHQEPMRCARVGVAGVIPRGR